MKLTIKRLVCGLAFLSLLVFTVSMKGSKIGLNDDPFPCGDCDASQGPLLADGPFFPPDPYDDSVDLVQLAQAPTIKPVITRDGPFFPPDPYEGEPGTWKGCVDLFCRQGKS